MKKTLVFEDGTQFDLAPITREEFFVIGAFHYTDEEYDEYLRQNNFRELSDFNEEELEKARIEFTLPIMERGTITCDFIYKEDPDGKLHWLFKQRDPRMKVYEKSSNINQPVKEPAKD